MSDDKNEPAFPVDSAAEHQYCGMTLRDYFAAKAMQAAITSNDRDFDDMGDADIAAYSYALADAMLAARNA